MKINRFLLLAVSLLLASASMLSCSVASTTAGVGVSSGATTGGTSHGKATNGSARNFAVKSYDKIVKDSQKGSGEYLNSLVLLMESEGVPKEESVPLIKRAARKSNGNAEIFGDEIANSL